MIYNFSGIQVADIAGRLVAVKGIGKMFYQEGFPISMAVSELKKQNIEVSMLHVADECIKNGWSAKTTYNKLKTDFEDDINGNTYDLPLLKKFCESNYEDQREMIFQYLFNANSSDILSEAQLKGINQVENKGFTSFINSLE